MSVCCKKGHLDCSPSQPVAYPIGEELEALPEHILVDRLALKKLQLEIESRIDQRHRELLSAQEGLFEKLRTEVVACHQVGQRPGKEIVSSSLDAATSSPDIAVLKGDRSNVPNPDAAPELAKPVVEPKNNTNLESESGEEETRLGEPQGKFRGQANLWAFMQVKDWDSDVSQQPDAEIADPNASKTSCWGKFESAIKSPQFDIGIGTAIMINAVVMGIQLEQQGVSSADSIGIQSDEGDWPEAEKAFEMLEHIFTNFFLLELILRVLVHGRNYFKTALNLMDFIVVVASLLYMYVFPFIGQQFPSKNITFLRLVRVFRIIRVLRVFRVFTIFHKLRQLVAAFNHSVWSLVWSVVLLSLVQLIASIFMTQSLQSFLQDENKDPEQRALVYTFFGSFSRSCITVFEMTLAVGTWGRCGRVVIFSVSRFYALFFIGYLALVSFAMIRVISAMFLRDTLASAAKDSEVTMAERNRDPYFVKQLWKLFQDFDTNQDGLLEFHELYVMLEDKSTCNWLKSLGVAPHEVTGLFTLMDDGDNSLGFCEFLTGVMRLQQVGKGVDLATLLYENKKILSRMIQIGNQVNELKQELSLCPSMIEQRGLRDKI